MPRNTQVGTACDSIRDRAEREPGQNRKMSVSRASERSPGSGCLRERPENRRHRPAGCPAAVPAHRTRPLSRPPQSETEKRARSSWLGPLTADQPSDPPALPLRSCSALRSSHLQSCCDGFRSNRTRWKGLSHRGNSARTGTPPKARTRRRAGSRCCKRGSPSR